MTDILTAMLSTCHDEHTAVLRNDVAQLDLNQVMGLFDGYMDLCESDDPFTANMAQFALAGLVAAYLSSIAEGDTNGESEDHDQR